MLKTIEGVLEKNGRLLLLEKVDLGHSRRVLITFLEDAGQDSAADAALVSEQALAEDWNRPEEDAAWHHLQ